MIGHVNGAEPREISDRRQIGAIMIGVLTPEHAIETILSRAAARTPTLVTFCNAHTVNLAARDSELAEVLNRSLVLNDGVGLDIASAVLYGARFPANLNGTDFMPALLSAAPPLRIYLLGARSRVVERAAAALSARFPQHRVVGWRDGFFAHTETATIREEIIAAAPDLILVGMGQPRQEKWAGSHFQDFPAVTICIGAYLDFAAGAVPRAPIPIRRLRLEWAFRLVQEPKRLARRYLIGNVSFLVRLARQRAAHARRHAG